MSRWNKKRFLILGSDRYYCKVVLCQPPRPRKLVACRLDLIMEVELFSKHLLLEKYYMIITTSALRTVAMFDSGQSTSLKITSASSKHIISKCYTGVFHKIYIFSPIK